jgi:hypothetical protein
MKIKRFNESTQPINENVVLYRLVSVPQGEPLVVDTENPGKYYFQSESDIKPDVLGENGGEYHVIKVNTTSDNVDKEASERESETHKCKCVVLKDDSKVEIDMISPLKKAA